jgi:nicotinamide-nucleotide amidase
VAQVPRGARKLANPFGTAPGLAIAHDAALVILLPGVPRELKGIFAGDLARSVREHFSGRLAPVHVRVVHTTGIPESVLSQRIAERLPEGPAPVHLAFLPDLRGVDLRFWTADMPEAEAQARFDDLEAALEEVVAPWRFHAPSGDLVEAVSISLRASGRRLAVAESCTGGLVCKRLTDFPGSSDVLLGGVAAYSNSVKAGVLGVAEEALQRHGAVSEPVATAMAVGVRRLLGAEVGVGITGVAGPGGGTDEKPVGTVWYAVDVGGSVEARGERFPGDREAVRERAAQAALFLLLKSLERVKGPAGRPERG